MAAAAFFAPVLLHRYRRYADYSVPVALITDWYHFLAVCICVYFIFPDVPDRYISVAERGSKKDLSVIFGRNYA
jgi:hypothetical protein